MRTPFLAPLALPLLLLSAPDSWAGWGRGGCAPVGVPVLAPAVPEWEWRTSSDGSRADLYHFGRYVRSHYYETEAKPDPFVPANAARPAKKADCDCAPCCDCGEHCNCPNGRPCCDGCRCIVRGQSLPRWMTHGTDPERLTTREEYRLGGRVVSREEALKALQAGQLTDDSKKPRLTVIGSAEERQKVLAGLPAEVRDRFLVKDYAPDHWAVKGAGFKTDGHPTVYVQAADGKVLHRQDDGEGVVEAVRKADPNYDPRKDPDLRKAPQPAPPPAPAPAPAEVPAWVWWAFTALAGLLGVSWLPPVVRAVIAVVVFFRSLKPAAPQPPSDPQHPLLARLLERVIAIEERLKQEQAKS
jgi:hypothetical protein